MGMRRVFTGLVLIVAIHQGKTASAQGVDLDDVSLSDLLNIKIESASKKVEPLSEAPVPVTVITAEMIKSAGVRTVNEALVTFVPGYTDNQDRNEEVFAARGIYATAQQKVLIMINGHRLNSRSYLTSMPDFGIAIHQLERIEVLRGPGSSLYGNVALSGVINLITKKGKDVGTSVDVAAGNWGQQRGRAVHGAGGQDWDLLAWGQWYRATGEVHELDGNEPHNPGKTGSILIDGVEDSPAHDFGATYRNKEWTLFAASRLSRYIEPYGRAGNATNPYDYGSFRTFNETGPGLAMEQNHLGVKYNTQKGGWDIEVNPYYDNTNVRGILANGTNGTVINWLEDSYGAIAQTSKDYKAFGGSGNLLMGVQVDYFEVTDSMQINMTGYDFGTTDSVTNRLLQPGGETIYSAFLQNKHRLSDTMILNIGARYDHKNRHTGDDVTNFSPRVAAIYLPNETWEHKLSFSQSFVDAPYWYRYNSLAAFGGSEGLNPEVLQATQFQTVWKSADKRKRNATTLYYQKGIDLVINCSTCAGTPADPRYVNSGSIESTGIENEFTWYARSYNVSWNLQYARALSAENYAEFSDTFAHVPSITSNLVFNYTLMQNLTANATLRYIGEQYYNVGTVAAPDEESVDAAFMLNLGARMEKAFGTGAFIDARVYNVMGTEHFQGGESGIRTPIRQPGRWYLATLGWEF